LDGESRRSAILVGGAELGAPMSQDAYRRVGGAATPKGAAQRGYSATGPTPKALQSDSVTGPTKWADEKYFSLTSIARERGR
jgi:hypothetical protein